MNCLERQYRQSSDDKDSQQSSEGRDDESRHFARFGIVIIPNSPFYGSISAIGCRNRGFLAPVCKRRLKFYYSQHAVEFTLLQTRRLLYISKSFKDASCLFLCKPKLKASTILQARAFPSHEYRLLFLTCEHILDFNCCHFAKILFSVAE